MNCHDIIGNVVPNPVSRIFGLTYESLPRTLVTKITNSATMWRAKSNSAAGSSPPPPQAGLVVDSPAAVVLLETCLTESDSNGDDSGMRRFSRRSKNNGRKIISGRCEEAPIIGDRASLADIHFGTVLICKL